MSQTLEEIAQQLHAADKKVQLMYAFRDPSPAEKNTVKLLLDNLVNNYAYWQQDEQNG